MKAGAIILAGGKSSRMGTNKALLPLNEKMNIERIKDELQSVFDDIILVTNDPETYEFLNIRTVPDAYPGQGPLAGLQAGLHASHYEENIVVACDMPFITAEIGMNIVKGLKHFDAVIPVIDEKQHPLFAAYQKRTAAVAKSCLEEGHLRMKDFLRNLDVFYLNEIALAAFGDVDTEKAFFNMNHPHEYDEAKKWTENRK
ncbi:molybdenum cofactor guanylyltransferase [Bacillus massilinigeriensis]|uniref:molybdenum cofactor guanylyltransferase n=1 Tax=Bacillus mediterraneensis TaxID=1805474 RepID=UPI0008F825B3|nr:molybdenum cofactor guanylyltransferase [Bacillus mediterraneensis]